MRILVLFVLLPAAVSAADNPVILVVGDSLSAAYGMEADQGWVALLDQRLESNGHAHTIVNASQSGATSRGALALLPRALEKHEPTIVIIEIGGNDGLRGLSVTRMRENIESMVRLSDAAGAKVIITAIRIPPNYGRSYTEKFHETYYEVAANTPATLVPHLLEEIAINDELMQADRIHPNALAQPRILEAIWPALEPLVDSESTGGGAAAAQDR